MWVDTCLLEYRRVQILRITLSGPTWRYFASHRLDFSTENQTFCFKKGQIYLTNTTKIRHNKV